MITARDIHTHISRFEECVLLADPSSEIERVSDWNGFGPGCLAFYKMREAEPLKKWESHPGGLIITHLAFREQLPKGPYLLVSDPQRAFIFASALLQQQPAALIHPTAVIHPEARIGKNCSVGAYSVIGKAIIGDHATIGTHVSIKDNVNIGSHAVIMNGVIIGEPGLGSIMGYDGNQVLFPHFGGVSIGHHFVIGSGSIVNCGALTDTIISDHVHVSSNCLVAHNCRLSNNVYIAASAQLAGTVKIGERCYIGFGVVITDGVELAEGITVGVGTTVMRSVLEKDVTLMNQPQTKNLGKLFSIKRK